MAPRFFGLTPSEREYILEATFNLMYYGGFTFTECYSMPVSYRTWFLSRLQKELSRAYKNDEPTKAVHHNNPLMNQMTGKSRSDTPARLRRFT